ncbi:MAG: aminoacyl-tRNA deacylase [Desulfobacterales bacterium]|jgi:Cys-tRNA(Pro)/Cys-tRNA(Cys) deacylase
MSTRAIQHLKRKDVSFELVKYEHEEKGAAFAARATGFPLDRTVKTLVVDLGGRNYCLALLPGDRQLDLKQLAQVFAVKRAAMADTATAERLTGYLVGGISPFGTKQALPSVMEKRIREYAEVLINAGQRGVMLKMAPEDIVKALGCRLESISKG